MFIYVSWIRFMVVKDWLYRYMFIYVWWIRFDCCEGLYMFIDVWSILAGRFQDWALRMASDALWFAKKMTSNWDRHQLVFLSGSMFIFARLLILGIPTAYAQQALPSHILRCHRLCSEQRFRRTVTSAGRKLFWYCLPHFCHRTNQNHL